MRPYLRNQAIELFRQLAETFCRRERPGNEERPCDENLSQRTAQIRTTLGRNKTLICWTLWDPVAKLFDKQTQTLTCSHPKHFYGPQLHESVDWNTKIYKTVKEDGSHIYEYVTKTWLHLGSGSTVPVITASERWTSNHQLSPGLHIISEWREPGFLWMEKLKVLQALCLLLLFISLINTLLCWEKLQLNL